MSPRAEHDSLGSMQLADDAWFGIQTARAVQSIILFGLYRSIDMLARGRRTLSEKWVRGIAANRDACRLYLEPSVGPVTALNPVPHHPRGAPTCS